jgi:predicted PurR-regulated permease PerM
LSAILTLLGVVLPVLAVLAYSYSELADVVGYASTHQTEITAKVDQAMNRLPFLKDAHAADAIAAFVVNATAYGTKLPLLLRSALAGFSVSATIFLFTAFYILIEAEKIGGYLSGKIPPRYAELRRALEGNVRGVLYGAIYSTLLTQTLKSLIILGMNLVFGVPLAGPLAVVSFVIGFFPIVGSWSVYVPVAIWLVIFRDAVGSAVAMVVIGTLVNTVFISTYLRPKIAADRSRVLNFYWMFVALITGVYTFGLAGILLGPILIGLLKAIVDTVTARSSWQLVELGDGDEELAVSGT